MATNGLTIKNGVLTKCTKDFRGELAIPDGVTRIGEDAFYGCSGLTSVTIPDSVTSIGGGAFADCTGLTSVTIPDSVTSIGNYAFSECNSLGYNEYDNAFYLGNETNPYLILVKAKNAAITSCIINKETRFIHSAAFSGCGGLISVTIPDNVTDIGGYAFWECASLTSITIPNSVMSIGMRAFSDCNSLTSVIIHNGVKCIGGAAFAGCGSLMSIAIPESVTSIGYSVFVDCNSLSSIEVDANNAVYASVDRVLYNKAKTELILIPAAYAGDVAIPNSVASIGENACDACYSLGYNEYDNAFYIGNATNPYLVLICAKIDAASCSINKATKIIYDGAFSECDNLTSITIPNSVTSIGGSAFSGCTSLTAVTIPDSVTSIGDYAFSGCTSLTSVTIPDSVTSIGWYAFRGCDSLTSVIIPKSVTSIGSSAFWDCYSLEAVRFEGTVEQWEAVVKGNSWNYDCPFTEVVCSDGVADV